VTNYAFASELGSGIYSIDGRTIQVYQIPVSFELRPARPHRPPPGINFLMPITFGLFNFQPTDLLHLDVPTSIGAVSLEPGVELDYWMSDAWHLYPYTKGRRELRHAELAYAGVDYLTTVADDSFVRLRDGAELRHNIGLSLDSRAVQLAPYGIVDVYLKPPSGPQSGISYQFAVCSPGGASSWETHSE